MGRRRLALFIITCFSLGMLLVPVDGSSDRVFLPNIISAGLMPVSWRGVFLNSSRASYWSVPSRSALHIIVLVIFTAASIFPFDWWCSGDDVFACCTTQSVVNFLNSHGRNWGPESVTICRGIPYLAKCPLFGNDLLSHCGGQEIDF